MLSFVERMETTTKGFFYKRIHSLWLLALPTAVAIVIAIVLMRWSIPVLVHVELTTQRVALVVAARQAHAKAILNAMDVRSVGIEKFSSIAFEPDRVEVAVPSEYDIEKDIFPSGAWKPLSVIGAGAGFEATKIAQHSRITVEEKGGSTNSGLRLDPIGALPGARVTMETRGGKNDGLAITVTGHPSITLSLRGQIAIIAEDIRMSGVKGPAYEKSTEVTYGVHLRENAPWIEIAGQPDGLVILPTFKTGQGTTQVASDVAVATLEFTRQDPSGERVSALTGNGLITFPAYPHLGSITINESDAVGLERLDKFSIKSLTLSPGVSGVRLVGNGMAGQIRTKTGQIPIERHLTAFDALTHNSGLTALFALVVWFIPTTIGALRLFKGFKD
jgi:hypothetical protein